MGIEMHEAQVKAVRCDFCGRAQLESGTPIEAIRMALNTGWTIVGHSMHPDRVVCEMERCQVAFAREIIKLARPAILEEVK